MIVRQQRHRIVHNTNGATKPSAAATGTIRADFGIDVGRNLVHITTAKTPPPRLLWFGDDAIAWKAPREWISGKLSELKYEIRDTKYGCSYRISYRISISVCTFPSFTNHSAVRKQHFETNAFD